MKRKILAVILSALMLALVIVPAAAMGDDSAKRVGEPTEKTEPVNNAASVRKDEEPKEDTEPAIDDTVVSKTEDPEPDERTNDSEKITDVAEEETEGVLEEPEDETDMLEGRPRLSAMTEDELWAFLQENEIQLIYAPDPENERFYDGYILDQIRMIEEDPEYCDCAFGWVGNMVYGLQINVMVNRYYGRSNERNEAELISLLEKYYPSLIDDFS